MKASIAALGLVSMMSAGALAEEHWKLSEDSDRLRFGYIAWADANNFHPLYFECEIRTKRISVEGSVGARRSASGQGTFTLRSGAGPPVSFSGMTGDTPFDGNYYIQSAIPAGHPVFSILSAGRDISYANADGQWPLKTLGLPAALSRFLAVCR